MSLVDRDVTYRKSVHQSIFTTSELPSAIVIYVTCGQKRYLSGINSSVTFTTSALCSAIVIYVTFGQGRYLSRIKSSVTFTTSRLFRNMTCGQRRYTSGIISSVTFTTSRLRSAVVFYVRCGQAQIPGADE